MENKTQRRRPRISTTIAGETLKSLNETAEDTGLPNLGVAIDYVVKDWGKLKEALGRTSIAVTERYAESCRD